MLWSGGSRATAAPACAAKAKRTPEIAARKTVKRMALAGDRLLDRRGLDSLFSRRPDPDPSACDLQRARWRAYALDRPPTFTTYSFAGSMRQQVCVYMCPWPRIQAQ